MILVIQTLLLVNIIKVINLITLEKFNMKVLVTLFQKRKDSLRVKVVVVAVEDTKEKLHEDTKEKCVLLLEEREDAEKNLENIKCKNIKNIGFLYFHNIYVYRRITRLYSRRRIQRNEK